MMIILSQLRYNYLFNYILYYLSISKIEHYNKYLLRLNEKYRRITTICKDTSTIFSQEVSIVAVEIVKYREKIDTILDEIGILFPL